MNTRAKWVDGIPDLYANLDQAGGYLTVAQVAERTGLAKSTITDLLSRAPITNVDNALAAISRPEKRIGNQPLYSPEQVAQVVERQRETGHRHLGGGSEPLVTLTPEVADERGLVSTEEIAEQADMHEQTVRRWGRDREDFPKPVALRARRGGHPGVPEVVRDSAEVYKWLRANGYLKKASA